VTRAPAAPAQRSTLIASAAVMQHTSSTWVRGAQPALSGLGASNAGLSNFQGYESANPSRNRTCVGLALVCCVRCYYMLVFSLHSVADLSQAAMR
jgi:hypothetical protein